jgi:rod shape determining protein RodA
MLPFITRKNRFFDYISFMAIIGLSCFSLFFVFSTTYQPEAPYSIFFQKQLFGVITGYILCITTSCIDYRRLQHWGFFLYFFTIMLLVYTLLKGSIGLGAQRWINVVLFKFQPSELLKLLFPPFFTYYLLGESSSRSLIQSALPILGILATSLLLIIKQPDLGTAIIIGLSSIIMLSQFPSGKRIVLTFTAVVCITAPITWHFLKPYQKQRVLVFLGQGNARKERYQIEQSFIAIGSGGMFGKGFLQGTQNILQFLPESRTDFIFSIIGEELGFVGACSVIGLYLILFIRWLMALSLIADFNAYLLALGLIAPIITATIINMAMVLGLLPAVGIPLPLISYGITHSWITMISIGFLHSILAYQLP